MRSSLVSFFLSTALLACSTSRDRGSPPGYDVSPYTATNPGASCLAQFSECNPTGTACCEGFCGLTGYGTAQCVPLAAIGELCMADAECREGICRDGACAHPTPPGECLDVGVFCGHGTSGACCPGLACAPYSYTRESETCVPLVELGGPCEIDSQCQTGRCPDGVCRGECLADNAECFADVECCTRFCTYSADSYAPGFCSAPLPAGSACRYDGWCASRQCVDGVCR